MSTRHWLPVRPRVGLLPVQFPGCHLSFPMLSNRQTHRTGLPLPRQMMGDCRHARTREASSDAIQRKIRCPMAAASPPRSSAALRLNTAATVKRAGLPNPANSAGTSTTRRSRSARRTRTAIASGRHRPTANAAVARARIRTVRKPCGLTRRGYRARRSIANATASPPARQMATTPRLASRRCMA